MTGFNQDIQHLGITLHVQTELVMRPARMVVSHLFHRGMILTTRKMACDPSNDQDAVQLMMGSQHKVFLREVTRGDHDALICSLVADAMPALPPPPAVMEARSGPLLVPQEHVVVAPAPLPTGAQRLTVMLPDLATLPQYLFERKGVHGILIQSPPEVILGEPVLLELHFARGPLSQFFIRGRTAWVRVGAGVGVEFLPEDEPSRQRLMSLAAGGPEAQVRRGLRVPVQLRVLLTGGGMRPRMERSVDLSTGGMFIATQESLSVGHDLDLTIPKPATANPLMLRARVVRHQPVPTGGVGVRFVFRDDQDQEEVAAFMDQILSSQR